MRLTATFTVVALSLAYVVPLHAFPILSGTFSQKISSTDVYVETTVSIRRFGPGYVVSGENVYVRGLDNTCQGSFEEPAIQEGDNLIVHVAEPGSPETICKIKISFPAKDTLEVESSGDCNYISGANCGFSGLRLKHKSH